MAFLKPILIAIGGASVLDLAYDYGFWIIIGAFSVIVQYVFSGVYRSENKGIKSNFPLALAAILNICLDPIFIYTFNMGVAGAAIATVLSNIISLMLFIYWRYIKGGELLDLNTYNKNMSIYKDIISVGVPASMEQILMSLFSMIINVILVMVATTEAVAVYTTVWRLISIGVMIPVGFGTGSISIFGALFGARKSETILESFKFTQIIGFVGSVLMAIILAIFSPLLALLFGGAGLNDQIISITVLLSLYVVFSSWSIVSGCILQSFGHGDYSLYFTFFKQIILTLIFIFLFIGLKETGVYYGIIAANFVGGVIEIIFTYIYVKRIQKYYK